MDMCEDCIFYNICDPIEELNENCILIDEYLDNYDFLNGEIWLEMSYNKYIRRDNYV